MEKTMNYREFLNAVTAVENLPAELVEYAQNEIAKLDATNEKRRAKVAEKAVEKEAERAPIRAAIVAVLTAEPKTASTLIADAGLEIKPQAIPSLLKGLVEDGTIVKEDIKVKGKGTQKGYKLA